MKTFVITLSSVFPTTHPRKGKGTAFAPAFRNGQTCRKCKENSQTMCVGECFSISKIHTIRANFPLWEKRIAQIQNGEAVLSIRQWTGKPYRSKQVEIARLSSEDGVGIQELRLTDLSRPTTISGEQVELPTLARNDGLNFNDWFYWFKGYDLSKPLAIIHFTKFRYGNGKD